MMENTQGTHYPDWNVLSQFKEWDPHTQDIVSARTKGHLPANLSPTEWEHLIVLCSAYLDEYRREILDFVAHHFDSSIGKITGESQRKSGCPPQDKLIKLGLAALDAGAREVFKVSRLAELDQQQRSQLVEALVKGEAPGGQAWAGIQSEFFNKFCSLAIEAYASHPIIWSEMGYAGPAYPRGYVRIERGLLDPWEAKSGGDRGSSQA